jgi:hypothetical protein
MFPYQQLATTMIPQVGQVICGWYTCGPGSCLRTCAWTCAIQSGVNPFPCYYSYIVAEGEEVDPGAALEQLRKNLELVLAGVQAQESLLSEWKSKAAGTEESGKKGRK